MTRNNKTITSIPTDAAVAVAKTMTSALEGIDPDQLEKADVPAEVRQALGYFNEVVSTAEAIATKQPEALADHFDEIADVVGNEAAKELLGSLALARMIAEVAGGSVKPVAGTAKSPAKKAAPMKKAAPKKQAHKKPEPVAEAPIEPSATPPVTDADAPGASHDERALTVVPSDGDTVSPQPEPQQEPQQEPAGPWKPGDPVPDHLGQEDEDDF